eukprot:scaffold13227_cov117-Isochrysis_galbana.AAC.19
MRQIVDNRTATLRLARPALATHYHRLVAPLRKNHAAGAVGECKDVRWHHAKSTAAIGVHLLVRV